MSDIEHPTQREHVCDALLSKADMRDAVSCAFPDRWTAYTETGIGVERHANVYVEDMEKPHTTVRFEHGTERFVRARLAAALRAGA